MGRIVKKCDRSFADQKYRVYVVLREFNLMWNQLAKKRIHFQQVSTRNLTFKNKLPAVYMCTLMLVDIFIFVSKRCYTSFCRWYIRLHVSAGRMSVLVYNVYISHKCINCLWRQGALTSLLSHLLIATHLSYLQPPVSLLSHPALIRNVLATRLSS